jgi:NifU-like protein involved in Fe-S cluster formation
MSNGVVTAGKDAGRDDPLGPQVRRLFEVLAHAGEMGAAAIDGGATPADATPADATPADATRVVSGDAGREQRGTRVRFTLRLAGDRLLEVRYRAYGCPYTLAACEWLAQRLEGGGLAPIGQPAEWAQALQIPAARMGRLLVVEDALRAAFAAAALSPTLWPTDS